MKINKRRLCLLLRKLKGKGLPLIKNYCFGFIGKTHKLIIVTIENFIYLSLEFSQYFFSLDISPIDTQSYYDEY